MALITTSREMLLKPLQAVAGIIERRHTLPILSNVLLHRSKDELVFLSTDIEMEITAGQSAPGSTEDRALTVGARKLLDILRALPDGAEVTLTAQDKRLVVKSGKSRYTLQTLPAEDFPRMAAPEGDSAELSVPQSLLKDLLSQVQYAMAQQDIRYYLNGLLLTLGNHELRVVATDGHRLAYASRSVGAKDSPRQEVIVPRKTILELGRLLSESDEPVNIQLTPSQARFSFGSLVLVSKLIDGKFPDYNRVIPKNHPKELVLNRVALLQALQRAAILTNDKFRSVRWVLEDKLLRISSTNTEQEEAQEELDVDYEGEKLDIGFNVSYLLDVLNNVGTEDIQCALGDGNSSALFTIKGRDDFKYVVMPMRI
jgi:DNA polymerase III subunit beta